jgi:hypothetical protein
MGVRWHRLAGIGTLLFSTMAAGVFGQADQASRFQASTEERLRAAAEPPGQEEPDESQDKQDSAVIQSYCPSDSKARVNSLAGSLRLATPLRVSVWAPHQRSRCEIAREVPCRAVILTMVGPNSNHFPHAPPSPLAL